MSATIDIIIAADDQATKEFAQVAKNIDANVKNIKEIGGRAKTSTEFVGTLANALGGTEIGSYAGQLAGLTDKVSQFAEVQKAGGAGAFAFKAGLAAAAGVIAYQVGSAIGNVIFQVEKWNKSIAETTEKTKEMIAETAKIKALQLTDTKEDIELIRDPAEKRQAYEQLLKSMQTEMIGLEGRVKQGAKEVKAWDAAWKITGDRKGFAEIAKQELAESKEKLKVMQEEALTLQRLLSDRTRDNEEIKKRNEEAKKSEDYIASLQKELELLTTKDKLLAKATQSGAVGEDATLAANLLLQIESAKTQDEQIKKSDDYLAGLRKEVEILRAKKEETAAVVAQQNTFGVDANAEAERLLRERDALKAKEEQEKKLAEDQKKLADEKINQAKQIEAIRTKELDKLAEERIALTQGKEAAHAFNLEKQGLSKTDAQRIAREQATIDRAKQSQQPAPQLQAQETRLLTIGDTQDVGQQQLQIARDSNAQITAISSVLTPILPTLVAVAPGIGAMTSLLSGILTASNKEVEVVS
jgi:hypothetical protein